MKYLNYEPYDLLFIVSLKSSPEVVNVQQKAVLENLTMQTNTKTYRMNLERAVDRLVDALRV